MRARVIGLGQAAAGDDGVGAAVVRALRERGLPDGLEVQHLGDPSALVAMITDGALPIILVDAVLGAPPGEVLEIGPEELAARAPGGMSSHGLGVGEALALAGILGGNEHAVRIVAVTIARPERYQQGLSPAVEAAVPRAVERVLAIAAHRRPNR